MKRSNKRGRSGHSKLPAAQRSRSSSSHSRSSSRPPVSSEASEGDESIPPAIGARVTSWFENVDEWYGGVIAACATFVPGMFFIKCVQLLRVHARGACTHRVQQAAGRTRALAHAERDTVCSILPPPCSPLHSARYDDGDDEWASLPDPMVRVVQKGPSGKRKNNMLDIDGRIAAELRLLRAQMKKEQIALRKVSSEKLKVATAKAKKDAKAAWAGKKALKGALKESKAAAAVAAANAATLDSLLRTARDVERQLREANSELNEVEGAHAALEKRNAALKRERDALSERERALQKVRPSLCCVRLTPRRGGGGNAA